MGTDGGKNTCSWTKRLLRNRAFVMLFVLPRKNWILFAGLGKMQQSPWPNQGTGRAFWSPPFWVSQAAKLMCCPALPFFAPSCLLGGTHVDSQAVFLSYFIPYSPLFPLPPLFSHIKARVVAPWTVSSLPVSCTSSPSITQLPVGKADLLYILPLRVNSFYHFSWLFFQRWRILALQAAHSFLKF